MAGMAADVAAPGAVPVTDTEREAAVERLRTAVGAGRLSLDEFDTRATRVWASETAAELATVTADLERRPGPFPPRMNPPTAYPPRPRSPVVARFGAIEVSRSTVRTPNGAFPLAGSQWHCYDYWQTRRVVPPWAIVLAVLGFFVVPFVSLLFLLVRQPQTTGVLQVAVTDGVRRHVVDLPVGSPAQARAIEYQVAHVRSLAGTG